MSLMDEIMPTVASAGFTQAQVINALRNNKDVLLSFRADEQNVSSKSILKIFSAIKLFGSIKNIGGYLAVALYARCTYDQARTIVNEILAAIDYIEANNLWGE